MDVSGAEQSEAAAYQIMDILWQSLMEGQTYLAGAKVLGAHVAFHQE